MTKFATFITPGSWNDLQKNARKAEDVGFTSLWIDDHLLNFNQSDPEDRLECCTSLAALAAITQKIRLGSLVLSNSFRNPALLGKMIASLDQISGGRIELGLGAGWYEAEYRAYGYPFEKASTRIEKLREGVEIMRKQFRGKKFDFKGKYWQLEGCLAIPRPIQDPLPIWIGGTGKKTTRVAVEVADGLNMVSTTLDETESIFERIEKDCIQLDKEYGSFKKSYFTRVHFVSNQEERKKVIDNYYQTWHPKPAREYFDRLFIGTIDEIREKIAKYLDQFKFDLFIGTCFASDTIGDPYLIYKDEIFSQFS